MKADLFNICLEITTKCNQNCTYCYNGLRKQPSTKNPVKVLDRILKMVNIHQLTITGGEPTVSESLLECVIHARMKGIKVVLITNASKDDPNLFSRLMSAGVSRFLITINSAESSIHDKMVQTKEALERTLTNVDFILKNKGIVIPTIILTKDNVDTIQSTFELFRKLNVKTVAVNRYNISEGSVNKDLILSVDSLRNTFFQINEIAALSNFVVTSSVCTPFCILNPKDFENIRFGSCSDNFYQKPITVDVDGNVRLCNHSTHNLGNIYKNTFHEMLISDYAMSWISAIPEYCQNCDLYPECKGGCKAASEQIYKSHLIVDPVIEYCGLTKSLFQINSVQSKNK